MLICPVCAAPLAREERAFRCRNGHSFDRARQGYVHLAGSRHPGDTKPMLQARRVDAAVNDPRALLRHAVFDQRARYGTRACHGQRRLVKEQLVPACARV